MANQAIDRNESTDLVLAHAVRVGGSLGVGLDAAKNLLGEDRFSRMMRDPVRSKGPNSQTVYFWNVVDYLVTPGLHAEYDKEPTKLTAEEALHAEVEGLRIERANHLERIAEMQAELRAATEWISVEEWLPEERGVYIALTRGNCPRAVAANWYPSDSLWVPCGSAALTFRPAAWRPLPATPKEEKSDG